MGRTARQIDGEPRVVGPGIRLHVLPGNRFTTTVGRVVLHHDLGPEATSTAILAEVLQSATARHPTRALLAHRLADLYGASLGVSVARFGNRQLLVAQAEWPSARVPGGGRRALARGLALLQEVLTEPLRRGPGRGVALDADTVARERVNHVRNLRALRDDKDRYAVRRCLEETFRGEAYGLDPLGREEEVRHVTPETLGALHGRLVRTAPVEVFVVGPHDAPDVRAAAEAHLVWADRSARTARVSPVASVGRARARPRRVREKDDIRQERLVLAFRAPVGPSSPLAPAALTFAGVLGGGAFGRLFKVLREELGICYDAGAVWHLAKGLLIVHVGLDAAREAEARRVVHRLVRETATGRMEERALHGYREAVAHRMATLADDRGALIAWHQEARGLGLDPSPGAHLAAVRNVRSRDVRAFGRRLALDTAFVLAPRNSAGGGGG